jgi:hypothetical protein
VRGGDQPGELEAAHRVGAGDVQAAVDVRQGGQLDQRGREVARDDRAADLVREEHARGIERPALVVGRLVARVDQARAHDRRAGMRGRHGRLAVRLGRRVVAHRPGRVVLAHRPSQPAGEDRVGGEMDQPRAGRPRGGRHHGGAVDVDRPQLVARLHVGRVHDRVRSRRGQRRRDRGGVAHVDAERPRARRRRPPAHRARDLAGRRRGEGAAEVAPEPRDEQPHRDMVTTAPRPVTNSRIATW